MKLIYRYLVPLFVAAGLGVSACSDSDNGEMSLGNFSLELPQYVGDDPNIPGFLIDDDDEFYPVIQVGEMTFLPEMIGTPNPRAIVHAEELSNGGASVKLSVNWYDDEILSTASMNLDGESFNDDPLKMVGATYSFSGSTSSSPSSADTPLMPTSLSFPDHDEDRLSNYKEFQLGTAWQRNGEGSVTALNDPVINGFSENPAEINGVAFYSMIHSSSLCDASNFTEITFDELNLQQVVLPENAGNFRAVHNGEFLCIEVVAEEMPGNSLYFSWLRENNQQINYQASVESNMMENPMTVADPDISTEFDAIRGINDTNTFIFSAKISDLDVADSGLLQVRIDVDGTEPNAANATSYRLVLQMYQEPDEPENAPEVVLFAEVNVNNGGFQPLPMNEENANECDILRFTLQSGDEVQSVSGEASWSVSRGDGPGRQLIWESVSDTSIDFPVPMFVNNGTGPTANTFTVMASLNADESPITRTFSITTRDDDVTCEDGGTV